MLALKDEEQDRLCKHAGGVLFACHREHKNKTHAVLDKRREQKGSVAIEDSQSGGAWSHDPADAASGKPPPRKKGARKMKDYRDCNEVLTAKKGAVVPVGRAKLAITDEKPAPAAVRDPWLDFEPSADAIAFCAGSSTDERPVLKVWGAQVDEFALLEEGPTVPKFLLGGDARLVALMSAKQTQSVAVRLIDMAAKMIFMSAFAFDLTQVSPQCADQGRRLWSQCCAHG